MMSFAPHFEVLGTEQREFWRELGPARELGLVLYGGTAIALRLGHRHSVDFDFFGVGPLDKSALRSVMPILAAGDVVQDAPDTLTVIVNNVKVSLFGVGVSVLSAPDETDDGVLLVASQVDLLAHKLKVILQRSDAKDYIDIAALLAAGVPLDTGLAGARSLFGATFPPAEALRALTYFGDGDLERVADPVRDVLRDAVRKSRLMLQVDEDEDDDSLGQG